MARLFAPFALWISSCACLLIVLGYARGQLAESSASTQDKHLTEAEAKKLFESQGFFVQGSPVTSVLCEVSSGDYAFFAHLRSFPRLRELTIYYSEIADGNLVHLKQLGELVQLSLGGDGYITDAGIAQLKGLTKLEDLDLYGTGISDGCAATLSELKQLRSLRLSKTKIGDIALKEIGKLNNLEKLWLHQTQVTDSGLKHLTGLRRLKVLWLPRSITNAGLKDVGLLTSLNVLVLSGSKINDDGLKHFRGLTHLKGLSLSETEINGTALSG